MACLGVDVGRLEPRPTGCRVCCGAVVGLLLGWVFREVKGLYDRVLRFAERLEAVRGGA